MKIPDDLACSGIRENDERVVVPQGDNVGEQTAGPDGWSESSVREGPRVAAHQLAEVGLGVGGHIQLIATCGDSWMR